MALRLHISRFEFPVCVAALALATACGGGSGSNRSPGQSDFTSRAPQNGASGGGTLAMGATDGAAPAANTSSKSGSSTTTRTVEETDLYRLEGNRLYYLNGYRGLMVFDVTDVGNPKLVGRSPIFGSPVEMIVRNGIATVVVADWYGTMDDGSPFYGSIVRGLDATNPAAIKVLGEARLGGWVRDTRVVGDVLYAVTEDYQWYYGWGVGMATSGGVASGYANGSKTIVSSVSFANGQIQAKDRYEVPGDSGVFNVTSDSILFAHDYIPPNQDPNTYYQPTSTVLDYIDISDPAGAITPRGSLVIDGRVQGWGADNGRWNLDFADGATAHAFGCASSTCWTTDSTYSVTTVDFTNPDLPVLKSALAIPSSGWSPTARFDGTRMYVAPNSDYYYSGAATSTPVSIYDLSDPAAPALAGQTSIPGNVWLFMPNGDRLFALGNDSQYDPTTGYSSSQVSLSYLDVSNPAAPSVVGTSSFGDGWAWTPAAGTFKAFTKDDTKGLVVLPFSGWVPSDYSYFNGLQLIEYTPSSIATAGAARTHGWVERGIFVGSQLVSLSDLALSVVDYTDRMAPRVVTELTLARNVVDAKPNGATIAELSSDWWDNDLDHSQLNVLPLAQAEETTSGAEIASLDIAGTGARIFHDGDLSYVVSNVRSKVDCNSAEAKAGGWAPGSDGTTNCYLWMQQIQVVDRSGSGAVPRGKLVLPYGGYSYYWGIDGWYGWWYGGWYIGDDVVQVGGNKLAFRRWNPVYTNGTYVDSYESLQIVDLSNPDALSVASTVITRDPNGWWGNMRTVGDTLYTSHYEWVQNPNPTANDYGWVKYYLDRIDLSDAAHPRIAAKINVPGFLVGASEADPSIVYTVDYGWNTGWQYNEFNVLRLDGDRAYLQSSIDLDGWVGQAYIRGDRAYMTRQRYVHPNTTDYTTLTELVQIDTADPSNPVLATSQAKAGWGWLLDVEGDRALVQSGWYGSGVDIYKLSDGAPAFDRTVRTRGWGANSVSRQDNTLFISSGYWGVQRVDL